MLDRENRINYASDTDVDADHHHMSANGKDGAQQLVLDIIFHVALAFTNLDVTLQYQGHSD